MGVSTGCFSQSSLVLSVLGCLLIKMDLWEIILPDIIDKVHENLGWLLIRMDLWEKILLDIIDKVHENLGWLLIKMDLLDMSINDLESLEVSDKQVWLLYLTWSNRWIFMSCLQLKSCGSSAFRWIHIRHDDVMKWKPFRVTGPLCGDRWVPHTKASDAELRCFYFICAWTNDWVNNRDVGDLVRHCVHYDVTVMSP